MVTVYHNVSVLRHALIAVEIHFPVSLVLYMIYYPQEFKYESVDSISDVPGTNRKAPKKRHEWQVSIVLAWIVVAHLYVWRLSRARSGLFRLASSYASLRSIFWRALRFRMARSLNVYPHGRLSSGYRLHCWRRWNMRPS